MLASIQPFNRLTVTGREDYFTPVYITRIQSRKGGPQRIHANRAPGLDHWGGQVGQGGALPQRRRGNLLHE